MAVNFSNNKFTLIIMPLLFLLSLEALNINQDFLN
jgi:hypothetical protein